MNDAFHKGEHQAKAVHAGHMLYEFKWIRGAMRVFTGVFALLAAYGCVLSIRYAVEARLWVSLAAIACIAAVCSVLFLSRRSRQKNGALHCPDAVTQARRQANWWSGFLVAYVLSIPLMCIVGIVLVGRIGADYSQLFELAIACLDGNLNPDLIDYYGAYPNNHFLLMLMLGLFSALRAIVPEASSMFLMQCHVVINVAMTLACIFLIALLCRRIWDKKRGAICGILLICYAPLWANCANPYTDTAALFIVALALFVFGRFCIIETEPIDDRPSCRRAPKLLGLSLAFGAICAVGFEFKATVAILVVAFILVAVFFFDFASAWKTALSVVVAFVIVVFSCNILVDAARPSNLPYGSQETYERQFPYIHWVMIGMNPESDGQWTYDDYVYTLEIEGKDAKAAADHECLDQRIGQLGGPLGVIQHIAIDKAAVQWAQGGFFDEGIFERHNVLDDSEGWSQKTSTVRSILPIYTSYAQAYHILLLAMVCIAAFRMAFVRFRGSFDNAVGRQAHDRSFTSADILLFFCMLALFGLGLFLCVVWEVKARYLLQFAPMLIIIGCQGLGCLPRQDSSCQTR